MLSKKDDPIVIWGAGGHATVVADVIRSAGVYEIAGFIDDWEAGRAGEEFCHAPVLGGQEVLAKLGDRGIRHGIIAIGDGKVRMRLAEVARAAGLTLISAVHPSAVLAEDVEVGEGTVVAAGVVVNPGTRLKDNVIVNTSTSVDHDCILENGTHVSPGVHLAGRVHIGRGSWLGIGVCVKDRISIGSNVIVGAGAIVLDDLPDGIVACGVPAKVMRDNT